MNDQKQQVIDRINQATNVLVAVSKNPSVDQLTAAIGLTLALHTLDKHATTVFSGEIPSTVEFLKPEETIEKNTDSLRDFIIALDKSKADKLRYKVEDKVVKIFITPYRTSIGQSDLQFSEGDFNVDVVICLGVHDQADLDQAITSHGRILHDAAVVSVNNTAGNSLGNINWQEVSSSSLSEMIAQLVDAFGDKILDKQIATALLTGIVAETDRFRNAKTSPDTMKASANLMAAGADQQLISTKLEPPKPSSVASKPQELSEDKWQPPKPEANLDEAVEPKPNDGTLQIDHVANKDSDNGANGLQDSTPESRSPQVHIDEHGQLVSDNGDEDTGENDLKLNELLDERDKRKLVMPDMPSPVSATVGDSDSVSTRRMTHAPSFDSKLTANTEPEDEEATNIDSLMDSSSLPIQPSYDTGPNPGSTASVGSQLPKINLPSPSPEESSESNESSSDPDTEKQAEPTDSAESKRDYSEETLDQIESEVKSSYSKPGDDLSSARNAVENAIDSLPSDEASQQAIDALNAQPLGGDLHSDGQLPAAPAMPTFSPAPDVSPAQPLDMPLPPSSPSETPSFGDQQPKSNDDDGMPPPPVPPPFMPGHQ